MGLAAVIGAALYALKGAETAQAYFAGYLLEQSLSVDNLFVFVLVFRYFGVSGPGQDRVLAWGIASAAVLRLLMVAAGAELIENFKPVLLVFAGILVYSSIKLAFVDSGDGDDEGEKEDLSDNAIVKICKRVLTVSDEYDGVKFFTEVPVAGDDEIGGSASSSSSSSSSSARNSSPLPAHIPPECSHPVGGGAAAVGQHSGCLYRREHGGVAGAAEGERFLVEAVRWRRCTC